MKIGFFGKIYTIISAIYFIISGFNALLSIESKLTRIGLNALDQDGKIAFILIYCGLMVGIGVAILLIYYFSKTWVYAAILAVTVISSFVCFRLVGAVMVGELSSVQTSYIFIEVVEVAVGLFLIIKSRLLQKQYA